MPRDPLISSRNSRDMRRFREFLDRNEKSHVLVDLERDAGVAALWEPLSLTSALLRN